MARATANEAEEKQRVRGPWALPDGWRWELLGTVASRTANKHLPDSASRMPFVGMDSIAPHTMRVQSTQPFGGLRSTASAFQLGDVLYGRLRPYLNKVWLATFDGACSGELLVLRPGVDLDAAYLAYLLHGRDFVEFAMHAVTGDRPRIDFGTMSEFQVPVPPVRVQRRIVARIDELLTEIDDGEAALARARSDLGTWRNSLLKAAVTGELTADWRAANPPAETGADLLARILAERRVRWRGESRNHGKRYVEPAEPDISDLPSLPVGWVWTTVGALLEGDIQNGLYLPQSAYGRGVPIVRIDDFQCGEGRPSTALRLVDADPDTQQIYALRSGDYVVNRVNSMSHLAKSFLVDEEHVPALFESNMMRMRPSAQLDVKYVELYLSSDIGRTRLCRNAKAAVNQASINQRDVNATPVPLPPRSEQTAIVEAVFELRNIAGSGDIEAVASISSALRQSILAAAFRGDIVA